MSKLIPEYSVEVTIKRMSGDKTSKYRVLGLELTTEIIRKYIHLFGKGCVIKITEW